MDMFIVIFAIMVFLLSYLIFYGRDRHYHLPPGPRPLPFIGTMHHSSMLLFENLPKIGKLYGDVSLFYAGPLRVVFINTFESARNAFILHGKFFSDRGNHNSMTVRTINPHLKGIIHSDYSSQLKENLSTTMAIFRDLGVGRSTMEEKIIEEAQRLVDAIKSRNGMEFDPFHNVSCSVANVILSIVLNKPYEHDDPELLKIINFADGKIETSAHTMMIDSLNMLRFLPPFRRSFKRMQVCDKGLIDFMWKHAEDHMKVNNNRNTDFVYSWITKSTKKKGEEMDKENFARILRDFMIAGTETTATSLKWTLIQLANNPEIQDKLHEEIDRNIGTKRQISLKDRDMLPYLEATILEVQRKNTIVPFALPHYTKGDTKIGKYDIPADTLIFPNLVGIHYDERTFDDPCEFRPERFVDSTGKFIKHPNVIPFGIGKRSCLGELLARQELFLFTAALVQNFKFMPPTNLSKIDDDGILTVAYFPKRFRVRALLR